MNEKVMSLLLVIIFTIFSPLQSAAAEDIKQRNDLGENISEIEYHGEDYLVENYQLFKNRADNKERPTVALALSGGGARAIANLGVIKALVENDIPIDMMTGTSMGSIIATFYGSGLSVEQIEEIVTDTPFSTLFNFGGGALLNSKKANSFMEQIAPQKSLENFMIPTAQLSFDLKEGKKHLTTEGRISKVLQAAYSIPGYFPIHSEDDHYYVDAGVLESSPAKAASLLGADFVIATNTPEGSRAKNYNYGSAFQSASRFIEILQNKYTSQILNRYSDFTIRVDVESFTFMDFNYASRLVEIGYNETMARMPELKKELKEAQISSVKNEEREYYNLDSVLRDLEFDRLIVEESGVSPLLFYGRDFSPFKQQLFRSPTNSFQFGFESYYNRLSLAFLGDKSWDDGYTASLRIKKLIDTLDLYLRYANDYDPETEDDYEAEVKFFGKRFNLALGQGRRKGIEYYLLGNDFRYLGEKFQWQSENDFFLKSDNGRIDLLSSQLINYDFTKSWSIGTKIVYNNSDFVESPLIYHGQELAEDTDLQASINFKYNYNFQLPLELLNFLQLTDLGGYLFVDYYYDKARDEDGFALGPAFNSKIYLLGLKPIEADFFAAHDFETDDQRYGIQFSYSF